MKVWLFMVEKIVEKYLQSMLSNGLVNQSDIPNYKYHILCYMETIIVICSLLVIGVFFKSVPETIMFIICFFSIRNHSGGFHFDNFRKCYIGSVIVVLLGMIYIRNATETMGNLLFGLSVISYIIIMIYGTINHPNIDMDLDEFVTSKKLSRYILSLVFGLDLFVRWLNGNQNIIMYIEYAISLCGILFVFGKVLGQHKRVVD